ncbi:MAG: L-serine ammonia-lyase, iron-sulfur-dependent subunit beta [Phascolarctobacterium sp.]|nr:L-serine ammonia-lyase, iron-sulfur-dependent subunit beta [Phascolarctobacterium sp.]
MNLIDVIGPVMIGPSSSHTAGAVRLGLLAASILGSTPVKAEINLHGSFAETYQGHGTDMALLAGLMGWAPDDARIPEANKYADECGMEYSYHKIDLGNMAHPNTVLFKLTSAEGHYLEIVGSSVGGGQVKVTEIDGFPVELTGRLPAILTVHIDTRGVIALVTSTLANAGVNIATMRLFRSDKGGMASMVIECDEAVPEGIINLIAALQQIESVRFIASVL